MVYKMISVSLAKFVKIIINTQKKKLSIKSSLEKVTFLVKSMFCLT